MRIYKVIKEHQGRDNCYNYPKIIDLKIGDILTTNEKNSGHDGRLFFNLNGTDNKVSSFKITTKHPYCVGFPDTDYLELMESL
jgi:hypothetical protein